MPVGTVYYSCMRNGSTKKPTTALMLFLNSFNVHSWYCRRLSDLITLNRHDFKQFAQCSANLISASRIFEIITDKKHKVLIVSDSTEF